MVLISYNPKAIEAGEALDMATREGAKCLGYDDLGELREGWLADIILIDRSGFNWKPDFNDVSITVYAANSRDVDTVIINGKPVMINKELLTIDTERLDFEVNRVVKELYGGLE